MQVFAIAPAGMKAISLIAVMVFIVLVPVIFILGVTALGSRMSRFEVSPEGLRLRGDLYGRLIPANQLRPDAAQRVDFDASPGLQPVRRTLGTGLPGYQSGWFRLQNGDSALLYLSDRNRVVYVPTTAGFGLLLSPADPDAFLSALGSIRRP
jgi:hypothetical protein